VDRHAYVAHVLHEVPVPPLAHVPLAVPAASGSSVAYGLGALALTVAVALFGLYRRRIPESLRAAAARFVEPPVTGLKAAHSGVIGDYVMWLAVGTAVLGGVWLLTLTKG
jgi:multicomponent Na+:H+ antiporter subunit D